MNGYWAMSTTPALLTANVKRGAAYPPANTPTDVMMMTVERWTHWVTRVANVAEPTVTKVTRIEPIKAISIPCVAEITTVMHSPQVREHGH